jgi:hypothetical protein
MSFFDKKQTTLTANKETEMSYMDLEIGRPNAMTSGRVERLKMKEGEVYYLSHVWYHVKDGQLDFSRGPRFKGAKRFYVPSVGYFLDNGSKELAALAGTPSKVQVASIYVVWPTSQGRLDQSRLGDYKVQPWLFSKAKYDTIESKATDWPLDQHDLKIRCTDANFQKLEIDSTKECILRHAKVAQYLPDIIARMQAIETGINDTICREMTPAQVREKLGTAAPVTGAAGRSSAGSSKASSQDEDSMENTLDDILG